MKIRDVTQPGQILRTGAGPEHSPAGAPKASFREAMTDINRGNALDKLTEMGQNIEKQGQLAARRCDITELKRYKQMLAEFMSEAVRYAYEFKKQNSRDSRGRHRIYAIIKRVNEKLEKLTQDILSGQAETLKLMAEMDEINGMLLDMLA